MRATGALASGSSTLSDTLRVGLPPSAAAGFDAHRKDEINFRYIGVTERDFEWITDQLVQVANRCARWVRWWSRWTCLADRAVWENAGRGQRRSGWLL